MVRGTLVVDVAAGELDGARRAIARAIVVGALGPARTVSLEGDAVVFVGGTSRGRIQLGKDGRASFELVTGTGWAAVAQAVGAATLASVTATLAFGWIATHALVAGAIAGALWAGLSVLRDRRRAARNVRALLGNLRLLLDA